MSNTNNNKRVEYLVKCKRSIQECKGHRQRKENVNFTTDCGCIVYKSHIHLTGHNNISGEKTPNIEKGIIYFSIVKDTCKVINKRS